MDVVVVSSVVGVEVVVVVSSAVVVDVVLVVSSIGCLVGLF